MACASAVFVPNSLEIIQLPRLLYFNTHKREGFFLLLRHYEKTTRNESKKEVGKWLMDVAKYILTAAIVTSFLGEFSQKWLYYGAGLFSVVLCFSLGLNIFDKNNDKNKE